MKKLPFLALLAAFSQLCSAQSNVNLFDFEQINSVPVIINNDSLRQAWAGGVNYAQVNTIDLNLDGTQDLVIYAKKAQRNLPFITSTNSQGQKEYIYAPEYASLLPKASGFMLMRDYNCDGKKDIFYSQQSSVYIYENTSSAGQLAFTPALNGEALKSNYGSGKIPLFVSNVDMPAIIDIDGDGDLDIMTFTNSGSVVEFHENTGNCGLDYQEAGLCWGYFSESGFYRAVDLDACTFNKKATAAVQHSGSSMLVLNLDGDGDYDLLLGNVSFPDITALYNGGNNDSVHFTSQDTLYPTYSTSLELHEFPVLFYEDVTFDGVPDLLASSYDVSDGSQNKESVYLYTNGGTTSNPVFTQTQKNFMQAEMIDLGAGAVPRFADLNGDSLQDLVVANYGEYVAAGQMRHYYHYYINTGTISQPAFTLSDTNLADIGSYGLGEGTIPAFGDLNGDGTIDMIVGDSDGNLHYFTNSSSSNPSFTLQTAGINSIDVGREAAPFLFDMDADGDLDLLVGNALGKIHYYKNSSASSPSFSLHNDFYGAIDVYSYQANIGASIPYVFEQDSMINLVVGSGSAGVVQFDSINYVNGMPTFLDGSIEPQKVASTGFEKTPFGIAKRSGRNQYLVRASELRSAGLDYGFITSLAFDVTSPNNATIWKLSLRLKQTNDSVLSGFHTNMTVANDENVQGFITGWNQIYLDEPFLWDGNSNLVVEVCFRAQSPNYNIDVNLSDVGYASNAIGDITGYNSLSAKGCEMPLKEVIDERPNMRFNITPAAARTASYFDGIRTAPAVADLDGDGFSDVVLGNFGGGLTYHKGQQYYVSIGEPHSISKHSGLQVYPNPGDGSYRVYFPSFAGKSMLEIYDLNGRLLRQQEISEASSAVDISSFSPGVYIFRLIQDGQQSSQKVMKY